MYQGLLHLHNFGRWILLILLVVAILKAIIGMSANKPFSASDKKTGLFLMITAHVMLLIGLYQWIAGSWGLQIIQTAGIKEVMHDKVYRYWAVEHFAGMLIAIILITIGRAASKKNISDLAKHTRSFWFYLLALAIILATVPWPFRIVGRPLFPGLH